MPGVRFGFLIDGLFKVIEGNGISRRFRVACADWLSANVVAIGSVAGRAGRKWAFLRSRFGADGDYVGECEFGSDEPRRLSRYDHVSGGKCVCIQPGHPGLDDLV